MKHQGDNVPDTDFFSVIRSQRGVRYYKPDPVSDEDIKRILQAAVWAPSGSNKQPWRFIVVRDPAIKKRLCELGLEGSATARGDSVVAPAPKEGPINFNYAAEKLPVFIMVCMEKGGAQRRDILRGGSIFPAVQNLMLAAAALGLGTRLTTIWHHKDDEVAELLGIPDDFEAVALLPLGYPEEPDHLGGSKRTPAKELTFLDHWGRPAS